MTRQEAIEFLQKIMELIQPTTTDIHAESDWAKAIDMAIYALGTIDELKKERDAALDTAFAALKMREDRKDAAD